MSPYRLLTALTLTLALSACATNEWRTITDVNEIASTRANANKPRLDLTKVLILRLQKGEQRVEVTSLTPAVVGSAKNGPRAARTIFNFSPELDKLVLFGQNVPEFKGYHREIPVAELQPGKRFSFPVVQEDGSVKTQEFTVDKLIDQI